MPGPRSVEEPMVNLNLTYGPKRAADRDLDPRDEMANRHELGSLLPASTDGPKPSTDPMTDPVRAAGGGEALCEQGSGSQHPAHEGWDLEYEWLQEMERENDEVGPWADFV